LMPQSASAAPSLDWDGKADITYQVPQSSFGFDVLSQSMNHGRKEARNAGLGLSGGVMLAIGIPLTILGVPVTILGISLIAAGALVGGGVGASIGLVPGIILLTLGVAALIGGGTLITKGIRNLSKISAHERQQMRKQRYAMKNQRKAAWGMKVSLAGVPLSR
jgi:hypothetical protein